MSGKKTPYYGGTSNVIHTLYRSCITLRTLNYGSSGKKLLIMGILVISGKELLIMGILVMSGKKTPYYGDTSNVNHTLYRSCITLRSLNYGSSGKKLLIMGILVM